MSWKTLGTVAPAELVDARLQLHHAAQVVASAGMTFLEPQADDSHPNLGWEERLGALVDAGGQVSDEITLDGKTLEDGYAWLAAATARAGAKLPAAGISRSAYEIPTHATGSGAAFSMSRDALAELARWFANGHDALVELAERTPGASEVRCWPHHFDLGALAVVATQPDGSLAKSIGMGLSPGDEGYAEPYWYVSPWPYPEPDALPALESGARWHTEGYTSAILKGSDLVEGPPESQPDRLHAFLDAAVEASRRVLAD